MFTNIRPNGGWKKRLVLPRGVREGGELGCLSKRWVLGWGRVNGVGGKGV
jgi:hypothetical protein